MKLLPVYESTCPHLPDSFLTLTSHCAFRYFPVVLLTPWKTRANHISVFSGVLCWRVCVCVCVCDCVFHRVVLFKETRVLWDVMPCRSVNSFWLQGADFLHQERCIRTMKVLVPFVETSVAIYRSTRRNIPETSNLHVHCCERFISQNCIGTTDTNAIRIVELPWK